MPPATAFPNHPVVYVCHHHNLRGPLASMAWLPIQVRPWALSIFFDKEVCHAHFRDYTFSERYGWPRLWVIFVAWLTGGAIPPLMRSMGALPVYRNSTESLRTLRASVDALLRGESLIIYPDIEYTNGDTQVGEMYQGFLLLERLWIHKKGTHLDFVPLIYSPQIPAIELGEPIRFEDGDFAAQCHFVAEKIWSSLNKQEFLHKFYENA